MYDRKFYKVLINNTTVNFTIDTGADVSVISEERY